VSAALVVEYYQELPERRAGESPEGWRVRLRAAGEAFRKRVSERYLEGTLLRLLTTPDPAARRAAVFALGQSGTMAVSPAVARRLRDTDVEVRELAVDALWSIWFRADSDENNRELQRLLRTRDREKARAGLDRLIERAPTFAEAYNQRAVLSFRLKDFERAAADCERVLKLNPHHFGALAGLGQCCLQMRKHKGALKAFRAALRINPSLDGVAETIRALENALGEEGRKDDKK
jgi:tetratricopeptide (TPR) repeat protein